jgi:hypothetical protein
MKISNKRGCTSAVVVILAVLTSGCQHSPDSVVAVTGTVIGLEIAQNPSSQVLQTKLGYDRSEVAIVPTNKCSRTTGNESSTGGTATADCNTTGGGAADTADVIMELRYSGIRSSGSDSAIYQRLAVGKNAVGSSSSILMFAKPPSGTSDPDKQAALLKATRGVIIVEDSHAAIIAKCFTSDAGGLKPEFKTEVDRLVLNEKDKENLKKAANPADLIKRLTEESETAIAPWYAGLPANCTAGS